jgi:hypothetical protein
MGNPNKNPESPKNNPENPNKKFGKPKHKIGEILTIHTKTAFCLNFPGLLFGFRCFYFWISQILSKIREIQTKTVLLDFPDFCLDFASIESFGSTINQTKTELILPFFVWISLDFT